MKIKDIIMVIAIMILTIFVTFYGINTFYPKPDYEDFCDEFKSQEVVDTLKGCEAIGGKWSNFEGPRPVNSEYEGWCDRDYNCRQELEQARKIRSRYVFFIALPLGILIIALGAFIFGIEAVGAGLMGGGVGTLIYGSGAFWPYTENWIRFLMSVVGLVTLIWFSYYFSGKNK